MDLSCPVGMTRWVRSTLYAGCVVCPRRETPEFPHPQQKRAAQHIRLPGRDDAYECLNNSDPCHQA